jgi:lysophospholipase L1-like esterase
MRAVAAASAPGAVRRSGLLALAAGISLLQGSLFVAIGGDLRVPAMVLALATVIVAGVAHGIGAPRARSRWPASRPSARKGASAAVLALLAAQMAVFGYHLATAPLPFRYRLLHLAVALAWVAPLVGSLLWRLRLLDRQRAYLLVGSAAVGLFLGDVVIHLTEAWRRDARLRGTGALLATDVSPHPELGYRNARYGSGRSYYPDNPRGYFDETSPASRLWRLERQSARRGRLAFLDEGRVVRIEDLDGGLAWDAEGFAPPPAWHVRLLQSPLARSLEPGRYELRLRGRAERPRSIEAGLVWRDASGKASILQRRLELTSGWRTHARELAVEGRHPDANVELRLGADRWPVELAEVELVRLPGGEPVEVAPLPPFVVDYSFNRLGCRGPDYEIPAPPGVRRVVVLGDSVALGVGVRQSDTVSGRLEARLRARAAAAGSNKRWEVVNCGVSGYDTRQERLFYELVASRYEPEIVLVALYRNDMLSYLEARERGYVERRPGRLELLLHSWNRLRKLGRRPPPPDFSGNVAELEALDRSCRSRGARLVAFAFRGDREPEWERLLADVAAGLEGTGIPFLDLGPVLLAGREPEDLWVHPTDAHPNELGHELAAGEIERFLDGQGLLER